MNSKIGCQNGIESGVVDRDGTRLRAFLASTRPLEGSEYDREHSFWRGRSLIETLAVDFDAFGEATPWLPSQCADVACFLARIQPAGDRCFCCDPDNQGDVSIVCGHMVILDFIRDSLQPNLGGEHD